MSEMGGEKIAADSRSPDVADCTPNYIGVAPASGHGRSGWIDQPIEKLVSHVTSGGTPEAGNVRYYTTTAGYPFAKIEDLTRTEGTEIFECEQSITEAALRETSAKLYPTGTILLSMYGTIGLAKRCGRPMTGNQALCALVPPFHCDSGYLLHHLDYMRDGWKKFSGQTTQANISGGIVRRGVISLPPRQQQEEITAVLDTLDTTIRQTEAIIAKLKQVKQGLLHDLLTRGIDTNGELRPPQSQAPHLYKQSPLGWIPKDWIPSNLGVEADFQSGYAFKEHELSANGMRVVRISNLHKPDFPYWKYKGRVRPSWVVNDGDLLFSWAGVASSIDAYLYRGETALLNQHIYNLRIADRVRRRWVFDCLTARLPKVRETIEGGAGQLHLTKAKIQQIQIPIPDPGEIAAIVYRLEGMEGRLAQEAASAKGLQALKSGLMDDLLSGRVRVTPLLGTAVTL